MNARLFLPSEDNRSGGWLYQPLVRQMVELASAEKLGWVMIWPRSHPQVGNLTCPIKKVHLTDWVGLLYNADGAS